MTRRRRGGKYHAIKTTVDSIEFDSKAEAERYIELKSWVQQGRIRSLEIHPKYLLQDGFRNNEGKYIRPVHYTADFSYIEDGKEVVEDVKGGRATQTPVFNLKAKLFQYKYRTKTFRVFTT